MRYPRLDVLRAIAIFTVFWHHVIYHVLTERGLSGVASKGVWTIPSEADSPGAWCSFFLGQYGGWGVMLFFVISGFCIHLSFLKWQASPSASGFWRPYFIRRFFRIYPPYLFALILACIPPLLAGAWPDGFQLWSHLFMVHNLHADTLFGINPSFWSLAVEWQLYLVYPFFLFFCRRWGLTKFLGVVLAIDLFLRAWTQGWPGSGGLLLSQLPFSYWLTWGAGAWCAERVWSRQPLWPYESSVAALLIFAAVVVKICMPLAWLSVPLASIGFALWCDVYARRTDPLTLAERATVPLGLVSYSFYLIHQPLIVQLAPRLEARLFHGDIVLTLTLGGLLMFGIIYCLSALMCRFVERPSSEAGHRLARS
jgi:peptidoglycan/LPS O-acetylase OafA/YrhL